MGTAAGGRGLTLRRAYVGHAAAALATFALLAGGLFAYRRWVLPFDGALTALLLFAPVTSFSLLTPFLRRRLAGPIWDLVEDASYLAVPVGFLWGLLTWGLVALRCLGLRRAVSGVPLGALWRLMPAPWDLGLALGVSVLAVAWGLGEASRGRVVRYVVGSDRLPPGTSIRVVQISDLHLGMVNDRAFVARLCETLRGLEPHLLVSTGDLLDGPPEGLRDLAEALASVPHPLGAYAVLGNHEHYAGLEEAMEFHRACGMRILRDQWVPVGPLRIVGVDDPGYLSGPGRSREEAELWGSVPEDGVFTLALKHRPTVHRCSAGRFQLMLCGHVHGGQIFPFTLLALSAYRHSKGLKRLKGPFEGSLVYVSAGTGTWGAPVRLMAPPEVTVFQLVHRSSELRGEEAE